MKSTIIFRSLTAGVLLMASVGGYVWAQDFPAPPDGPPNFSPDEEKAEPLPPSQFAMQVSNGIRTITSNGIPNHPTGTFPNPGNPNAIRAQNYKFKMPSPGQTATRDTLVQKNLFGVALSGVPFDPGTAEFWNNDRRWNYDALSGKINLGTDMNNAHVQPGGVYHYHGLPNGLIAKLSKKDQMTLVGYAADGFPIYSNAGYSETNNPRSPLKKLQSGYRLKEGTRPTGDDGPGGAYDGTFSADWEYVAGTGDLDECNGRSGVTPEYPKGTYYYVLTDTFPFVPREFKGTPDSSFTKGPPPNGRMRQGGPGGPPGRGFPGRGGFPGPDGPPPPFAW